MFLLFWCQSAKYPALIPPQHTKRITYITVRQRVSQRGCCSQVSACGFWLRACEFKVVEVIPPVEQHLRRSGVGWGGRCGSRWSLAAPMRGGSVPSPGVITVTDKNQSGVTAVIFLSFFLPLTLIDDGLAGSTRPCIL